MNCGMLLYRSAFKCFLLAAAYSKTSFVFKSCCHVLWVIDTEGLKLKGGATALPHSSCCLPTDDCSVGWSTLLIGCVWNRPLLCYLRWLLFDSRLQAIYLIHTVDQLRIIFPIGTWTLVGFLNRHKKFLYKYKTNTWHERGRREKCVLTNRWRYCEQSRSFIELTL